jgi:hypothetical protein
LVTKTQLSDSKIWQFVKLKRTGNSATFILLLRFIVYCTDLFVNESLTCCVQFTSFLRYYGIFFFYFLKILKGTFDFGEEIFTNILIMTKFIQILPAIRIGNGISLKIIYIRKKYTEYCVIKIVRIDSRTWSR